MMIKSLRAFITASLAIAFASGCSSAPSMEQGAPMPTEVAAVCAVRHQCSKVPAPTAEEIELCSAIFSDLAAECRTENIALFVCSMRAARCDADGEIDDEATMNSLMQNCDPARLTLERCCETTGSGDNVHCGLFREEGDPVGDDVPEDEATDDSGATTDDAGAADDE